MVPLLVPLLSDAKISIFSVPVENRKKALVGIKMEFNFRKSGTKSGTKKRNPLGLSGFKWCWENDFSVFACLAFTYLTHCKSLILSQSP